MDYKLGIRTESLVGGLHLGVGIKWFTERAIVIDFLLWEISIGLVYGLDK